MKSVNQDEQLFRASEIGDLVNMMSAIALGADVNSKSPVTFKSPIHAACENDHTLAVELLCQVNNSSVDLIDGSGKTPLDYATNNEAIIDILVKKLERDLE